MATKDGHLIARHEPNITTTTDVASHPEFADRETTKVVERMTSRQASSPPTSRSPRSRLCAPSSRWPSDRSSSTASSSATLREVIALAKRMARQLDHLIGVYPETKHPTYHADLGLPLERRLVRVLSRAGWNHRHAPVFIQSFEQSNLKLLNGLTRVRLVQLVDANDVAPDGTITYAPPFDRPYDWSVSGDPELQSRTFGFFVTDEGLEEISTYADGIGPWKPYIVSSRAIVVNPDGTVGDANGDGLVNETDRELLPPTDLVERAHDHGLLIHHVDVPQRAAPAGERLRGQPDQRVPAVLRARRRWGLLGLLRHRLHGAGAVQAGAGPGVGMTAV